MFWIGTFNYGLYLALLTRLVMPTLYTTFRVSILGSLPDAGQLQLVRYYFTI